VRLDRNGLEVLDRDECRQLLGTQLLGRIGVTVDALPVVLPVNFQLFDGEIVIQTERDTRLAEATDNAVVAFEVDNAEPGGTGSWSVTLTGIATEITDPELISQLRLLPFTRWVRSDGDRYVGISLDLMSGRRVAAPADSERDD
jgi:nitroimidazol reductase NimA-like FMN-containing flavoprotein (pyridoxamine 5'-phosphate oxidase superfamily)